MRRCERTSAQLSRKWQDQGNKRFSNTPLANAMTSILDKFSAASASFQPATSQDFFALRLAQKLDDTSHVPQYVALVAAHRPELLLVAYQHAADASPSA